MMDKRDDKQSQQMESNEKQILDELAEHVPEITIPNKSEEKDRIQHELLLVCLLKSRSGSTELG